MGEATPEPFAGARANRSALGLLLVVVLAVSLVSLPSEVYHGDPSAVRMEAAFLVAEKGLGIPDDVVDTRSYRQLKRNGYFARNQATGRWYSRYGLANTLLAVPPLLVERALHSALIPGLVHSDTLPLVLGLYNLPFALGIAWLLWQILSLYTENAAAKLFFVLSTLYAT